MKKLTILFLFGVVACSNPPTASVIVDQAIENAGMQGIKNASASFTFRNIRYDYQYREGLFEYTRTQTDTLGNEVKDVLTNEGLIRYINDDTVAITEERRTAYTSSVNSVIYFAFLPGWLNDGAVIKEFVGKVSIDKKPYYKIKVTFNTDGGGEDHEDVFYYWFDTEDYSMDYLAYSYLEKDGEGIRFRVAYNERKVNGVIIRDYRNLKPKVKGSVPLESIDQAYQGGELEQLSVIELDDVNIRWY